MSVAIPRSPSRATFAHSRRQSASVPPRSLPPSYTIAPPPPVPSLHNRAPAPAYSRNDRPDGETRFVKADRTRMWIQQTAPAPTEGLQMYGYATEIGGVPPTYITPPASPSAHGSSSTFPGYAFAMPTAGSRRKVDDEPSSPTGPMPSGVMGRALARSMGGDVPSKDAKAPKRSKSATAMPKGVLRLLGRKDTADEGSRQVDGSFMDMSRR